jgi:hypothetical protein
MRYAGESDWTKVEQVAILAIANTQADEGSANYAAIYHAASFHQLLGFDLFRQSKASWPRMKSAIDDLLHYYPNSRKAKNWLAYYACRADDAATYRSAATNLGSDYVAEEWSSNYSVTKCRTKFFTPTR